MTDDPISLFRLDGKRAIVTGGAHGIGRAIVELFTAAGARVALADRDIIAGQEVADASAGTVRTFLLDQEDPDSIVTCFEEAEAVLGGLDILVNCAAIYPRAPLETAEIAFIDRMLDINLRGVLLCVRAAVARMKRRGGSIVNISSIGATRVCIHDAITYGVSKAGVNGLTTLVGFEYAEYGIRVNAIMPGGIATPQASRQQDDPGLRGPFTQSGRIPLGGRLGEPIDVAAAALFFASDAARYITGQILAVDGGFLIS